MDYQATSFPFAQPYEGEVVGRDDPLGLGRVQIRIPGHWEPHGPWVPMVGGRAGGSSGLAAAVTPPEGSTVLVFFVNGNAESPRAIAGHLGVGEVPDSAVVSSSGDARILQDGRTRIELDSRFSSAGLRIVDLATGGVIAKLEIDLATAQIELQAAVSVKVTSPARIDLAAPAVTINGRVVLANGRPI